MKEEGNKKKWKTWGGHTQTHTDTQRHTEAHTDTHQNPKRDLKPKTTTHAQLPIDKIFEINAS